MTLTKYNKLSAVSNIRLHHNNKFAVQKYYSALPYGSYSPSLVAIRIIKKIKVRSHVVHLKHANLLILLLQILHGYFMYMPLSCPPH